MSFLPHILGNKLPEKLSKSLPILASNELVPFPLVLLSYEVSDLWAWEPVRVASLEDDALILLAVFPVNDTMPSADSIGTSGVIGRIVKTLEFSVEKRKVLVEGLARVVFGSLWYKDGCWFAEYDLEREVGVPPAAKDLQMLDQYLRILVEREYLPEEMLLVLEDVKSAGSLADLLMAQLCQDGIESRIALNDKDPLSRLNRAIALIANICNQVLVAESVQDRVRDKLQGKQREYYLREQIKHIQDELGQEDFHVDDVKDLKEKLVELKLSNEARNEAMRQLNRLQNLSPDSGEYSLLYTYLDWICEIPWGKRSRDRLDPKRAARLLDRDHYGLRRAKDRILEYLSVRRLNRGAKGPILCFVGPPGVGKTSLGISVARALGRSYHRISLGGMRDEAEIRGHRRTYLGAMPGRVIQALKSAGTMNPVIVLDEIDKIGNDFRGDPASALLEVLDPHQNKEFRDHYLNLTVDLSGVLFIATANTVDTIPDALLDRMEVIFVSGYTLEEKLKIASLFVVPRQLEENGLGHHRISFTAQSLALIIERYTEEAGVRNLEREISNLTRKMARRYVEEGKIPKIVTPNLVQLLLGPSRYDPEHVSREDSLGIANGLAWTVNGGEIMVVEASIAVGSGNLTLTGQLGHVMQESAQAALSYARVHASDYGIAQNFYEKSDIHIHVPAGATPKDGPSAGVTILCALLSVLTNRPVDRSVAMTGEITLNGKLLPVGGLKEKILAAQRAGIERVFIPKGNEKDLIDVPVNERQKIHIISVSDVEQVLKVCLVKKKRTKKNAK
jgi:ATP-dependent Lon protease